MANAPDRYWMFEQALSVCAKLNPPVHVGQPAQVKASSMLTPGSGEPARPPVTSVSPPGGMPAPGSARKLPARDVVPEVVAANVPDPLSAFQEPEKDIALGLSVPGRTTQVPSGFVSIS